MDEGEWEWVESGEWENGRMGEIINDECFRSINALHSHLPKQDNITSNSCSVPEGVSSLACSFRMSWMFTGANTNMSIKDY